MYRIIPFMALVIFSAVSCTTSKSFFTESLKNNYNWSDNDLKNIQFYISNDIVLWNEIQSGQSRISNGKIKTIDGKKIEEVVIKAGTPGVFLFSPKKDNLAISFDPNDDSKYLIFGPSDKMRGRYVLLAKSWNNNLGKVTYGDQIYNTYAASAFVNLLVDINRSGRTKVVSSTPRGRKI
ncbi:MAG: hypothetical protein KDC04_04995 [Saprospiraceae bacterium]|nr:hypothetical protein [Saprospiraceae bacterium]